MEEIIYKALITIVIGGVFGLLTYLSKRMIDQLDKKIDEGFKNVCSKIESVDTKVSSIQKEIHNHDISIAVLSEKVESVEEDIELLGKSS